MSSLGKSFASEMEARAIPGWLEDLPVDEVGDPTTSRQVSKFVYTVAAATPAERARCLLTSLPVLNMLGVSERVAQGQEFAACMSGASPLLDRKAHPPVAHNYCGHQRGLFSGQLGDGAVISLGRFRNAAPGGSDSYELQLKGSGPTPFSNGKDGASASPHTVWDAPFSPASPHALSHTLMTLSSDSRPHPPRVHTPPPPPRP